MHNEFASLEMTYWTCSRTEICHKEIQPNHVKVCGISFDHSLFSDIHSRQKPAKTSPNFIHKQLLVEVRKYKSCG